MSATARDPTNSWVPTCDRLRRHTNTTSTIRLPTVPTKKRIQLTTTVAYVVQSIDDDCGVHEPGVVPVEFPPFVSSELLSFADHRSLVTFISACTLIRFIYFMLSARVLLYSAARRILTNWYVFLLAASCRLSLLMGCPRTIVYSYGDQWWVTYNDIASFFDWEGEARTETSERRECSVSSTLESGWCSIHERQQKNFPEADCKASSPSYTVFSPTRFTLWQSVFSVNLIFIVEPIFLAGCDIITKYRRTNGWVFLDRNQQPK